MSETAVMEDCPALIDDDIEANAASDSNDSNESDLDEDEELTNCLFCAEEHRSVDAAIDHVNSVHGVSFAKLKRQFRMDQYAFLKLINYIRLTNARPEDILQAKEMLWKCEKYLKPKCYEPWLTYDYDELPIANDGAGDSGNVISELEKLQMEIAYLKEQVNERDHQLAANKDMMAQMRQAYYRVVDKEQPVHCKSENTQTAIRPYACTNFEDNYFTGYSSFDIHHEMLSDVVRTTSYRDALLKNNFVVQDADVLDVGCGTGVLSIFASQAGAKRVVGIDNSEIIYHAMDIIKMNNINNVTLVKGRLEEAELPVDKFNIIVSEWMGYFLLYEGMLDTIIHARDKYLKPGGILLPSHCTLHILGYGSDELYKSHVTFWDDVYGLNMSNIRKESLHDPLIQVVNPKDILTESCTIADFDLYKVDINYPNFSYQFNMKCVKDGNLSAFVGYFNAYFEVAETTMFGTSPTDKPTHWKQTVFFLDKTHPIKAGDVVSGTITSKRNDSCGRSLDITIEIFGSKFIYYLE